VRLFGNFDFNGAVGSCAILTAEHTPDPGFIGGVNFRRFAQVAFPLGRFLRQYMALVSVVAAKLAGSRLTEPFAGTSVSLDLRHLYLPYNFLPAFVV
jgi:hypothetical protein